MNKTLIVNADDYGRTPSVSAGIRQAHLEGIVTSTTAMMNMPQVEEDLRKALQVCPDLGLGVHLVLTSGLPLLPAGQVNSITAGRPAFPGLAEFTDRLPEVDPSEVSREWQAQVERFIRVTGREPDHLDSHHHISYYTPEIFSIMLDLADQYGASIRLPTKVLPGAQVSGFPEKLVPDIVALTSTLLAKRLPPHPDTFTASFYEERARLEMLFEILACLPDGVTELMCHPGYVDDILMSGSTYNRQRETELQILTSPELAAEIASQGIRLVNFTVFR
jgi:predicted glycoside hydrolase/deacetylase ChbG (UPF0249 family)